MWFYQESSGMDKVFEKKIFFQKISFLIFFSSAEGNSFSSGSFTSQSIQNISMQAHMGYSGGSPNVNLFIFIN